MFTEKVLSQKQAPVWMGNVSMGLEQTVLALGRRLLVQ
jgi:hypothetical protein